MFKIFCKIKNLTKFGKTFSKKWNGIKAYNEEFIYNLFNDKKVEKYLAQNYNIDKCLLNDETMNNVKYTYNSIVYG
jgi:hypothetical protein